jgi:hypothetical protein
VTCQPNADVNEDTVVDDFDIEITKGLFGFVPTVSGNTYQNFHIFTDSGGPTHQTHWMPLGVPAPIPANMATHSADARGFLAKLDQNKDGKIDQLDADQIDETRDLIETKQCAPSFPKKCLAATAMGKLMPYAAGLAAPSSVIDSADLTEILGCIGSDLVIPVTPNVYPVGYNCPAMNLDAECNRVSGVTPNPNPSPDPNAWCKASAGATANSRGSDWGYYPVGQRDAVLLNLLWKNQMLKTRFLKSCPSTKQPIYPPVPTIEDAEAPRPAASF